ncbi:MAG: 4Fe-4S dicluster domain-containing protein [Deltaproteobacteria bacterium]|jgi:tetrathionate reductase subunit B|nr:4Fe-4S dicluster domain-containing protein [Deltaproteobacteria bacterium]MCL5880828.1 4Fe-4S dicluster domain-containing protein [Deltaproteobacteria bacterium]MDA8304295.1 4Fe-4S dicluster domain-containing protein [Deltaproteobacteria bacterium]
MKKENNKENKKAKEAEKIREKGKSEKSKRRKFLKMLGLGGLTLAIGGAAGLSKPGAALASPLKKRAREKIGLNTPEKGTGVITGPLKNMRWMGWMNPSQDVNDGWNEWMRTIENPHNLPIWHDNFYTIKDSKPKHHWAMVMDLRKCVGCQACVIACKSENNVPLTVFRTVVQVMETGHMVPDKDGTVVTDEGNFTSDVKRFNLPRMCNHCDHPSCVEVCPVKATFKRQDGIVLIDYNLCIGCGTCLQACPYDMRFFNPVQHTADKCTFCVHRIDRGLMPACVTSCVGRARKFGDLNDPKSEVSRLIAEYPTSKLKISTGNDPQVFYIDLNGRLVDPTNPEEVKMVYTYAMSFNTTAYQKLGGTAVLPIVEEMEDPYKD